jgi:hypothetical protein
LTDIIDTFDRPLTLVSIFNIVSVRLNILGRGARSCVLPEGGNGTCSPEKKEEIKAGIVA